MTDNESIKTYRATVVFRAYSFSEAHEELTRDGYKVRALEEIDD